MSQREREGDKKGSKEIGNQKFYVHLKVSPKKVSEPTASMQMCEMEKFAIRALKTQKLIS